MRDRRPPVHQPLGPTKFDQQLGALILRARLGQRPVQIRHRRIARTNRQRNPRGATQRRAHLPIARRTDDQQLRGDPLRRSASIFQQPRRVTVQPIALIRREIHGHRVANDRVR